MSNRRSVYTGLVSGIISALSFGASPLFARHLYAAGFSVEAVLFFRFFPVMLILGTVLLFSKQLRFTRSEFFSSLISGVIFTITSFLLFLSYRNLDVGLAAAILFLYPVYVVLVEMVFFKKKLTLPVLAALLLALAGVAGLSINSVGSVAVSGLVLALLSGVCYAGYQVFVSHTPALPALKQTFIINTVCALFYLVRVIPVWQEQVTFTLEVCLNIAGVSLISALLATYGAVVCLQKCGAVLTGILGALEPLTAVVLGIVCFNENAGFLKMTGIILILGAVLILALHQKAGSPLPDEAHTS